MKHLMFALLLSAVGLLVIAGCQKKSRWQRVLLSGTVTYQGEPVELGQIRFLPVGTSQGPITIEDISEGRYSTDSTNGVPVGTHRVEITSYDPDEYNNAPTGPGAPPVRQLLPNQYNKQSELTLEIAAEPTKQTHDFDLQ